MKRDMDKIREIMIYLEENLKPGTEGMQSTNIPLCKDDSDDAYQEFSEYIQLLIDSNFIEASKTILKGFRIYLISRITANGHDFLDAVRKDTTWEYAKNKSKDIGGSTLSIMIEIAKEYLIANIK